MMKKHDAERLYSLLIEFCDVACGKDVSCEVIQEEIRELAGYIAYCTADESSFAEADDYANARAEASKWICD